MRSSLESKTIRPGLAAYSFYRSDRRPISRTQAPAASRSRRSNNLGAKLMIVLAVIAAAVIGFKSASAPGSDNKGAPVIVTSSQPVTQESKPCDSGNLSKYIIVGIQARHMWACEEHKEVYDAPVITGMEMHASTKTPLGTYRIASKQTNTTLTGSDEAGSWSVPVHYWMPWLTNQYGEYGFHDATWRPGNPFGKISPSSTDASHGCVELPLAATAWLYNWAEVGTTVAVES